MLTISRILVPIDFSEYSGRALMQAVELARVHDAQLVLVHVVEEPSFPSFYGAGAVTLYGEVPDLKARAHDALEKLVADLTDETPAVETHVLDGDAPESIVAFAENHDIDLIVIASHGRSGVKRALLGSVAEKVIRHATCPVFVVKAATGTRVSEQSSVETPRTEHRA